MQSNAITTQKEVNSAADDCFNSLKTKKESTLIYIWLQFQQNNSHTEKNVQTRLRNWRLVQMPVRHCCNNCNSKETTVTQQETICRNMHMLYIYIHKIYMYRIYWVFFMCVSVKGQLFIRNNSFKVQVSSGLDSSEKYQFGSNWRNLRPLRFCNFSKKFPCALDIPPKPAYFPWLDLMDPSRKPEWH